MQQVKSWYCRSTVQAARALQTISWTFQGAGFAVTWCRNVSTVSTKQFATDVFMVTLSIPTLTNAVPAPCSGALPAAWLITVLNATRVFTQSLPTTWLLAGDAQLETLAWTDVPFATHLPYVSPATTTSTSKITSVNFVLTSQTVSNAIMALFVCNV